MSSRVLVQVIYTCDNCGTLEVMETNESEIVSYIRSHELPPELRYEPRFRHYGVDAYDILRLIKAKTPTGWADNFCRPCVTLRQEADVEAAKTRDAILARRSRP